MDTACSLQSSVWYLGILAAPAPLPKPVRRKGTIQSKLIPAVVTAVALQAFMGAGNEAHLMVYNDSLCTDPADPWLDTVTGRCRKDVATPIQDLQDADAALDARITSLEAIAADHESRITALEP
ncbi:MAG TPA: hypothetical protein ENO23_10840 [Alphaproteobacteria bacterium]|nr:hypothetical protein [Alphaproteobacteria bacterium]